YPLGAISENPLAADHLAAFAVRFCGLCYAIVVTHARVRLIFEHELDLTPVPAWPSRAGQNPTLFKESGNVHKSIVAACEHLEDFSDNFRLFLVDHERGRRGRRFPHVVVPIDAVSVAA